MREDALVGGRPGCSDAGQQRALEPAAMLIRAAKQGCLFLILFNLYHYLFHFAFTIKQIMGLEMMLNISIWCLRPALCLKNQSRQTSLGWAGDDAASLVNDRISGPGKLLIRPVHINQRNAAEELYTQHRLRTSPRSLYILSSEQGLIITPVLEGVMYMS